MRDAELHEWREDEENWRRQAEAASAAAADAWSDQQQALDAFVEAALAWARHVSAEWLGAMWAWVELTRDYRLR